MRTILLIIQKELLQVFRNKAMLPLLTVIPVVQLILLSFAASNEVKDIALSVVDHDHSSYSRLLLQKMTASGYFKLQQYADHHDQAERSLQTDEVDMVLEIPNGFERDLLRQKTADLQLLVNAINGSKGGLAGAYAAQVIQNFNQEIIADVVPMIGTLPATPRLDIQYSNWYNPTLDYKTFMVPGILGTLVTIIVMILTAMNIVREKEIGTIEQLNVTPIKKYQFILGKLLPFLFIGLFDLAIGLVAGKLIFDIPMVGSLGLVFAFCVVNLIVVLGIGLLISTMADTQQQAMFVAWFFMMIFILMSGLFTPIESMPKWAQYFTYPNPIAHFVEVMRRVLLKGSTFADIQWQFAVMTVLAITFSSLAMLTYRKTT
ncbi:MAG: ABC transporter permease [Saprospiraceae bacterium]|nr:MAG: ABC transporter permease [Saprospiraceae bacterium]